MDQKRKRDVQPDHLHHKSIRDMTSVHYYQLPYVCDMPYNYPNISDPFYFFSIEFTHLP